MIYSSSFSETHSVFTSRQFTNRDEAREAMEFLQEMGLHKSLDEECYAEYSIVTYTRFGDVVHSKTYDSECHESSTVSSDRKLRVSGSSVPGNIRVKVVRKPRRSRRSSSKSNTKSTSESQPQPVRRSARLAKNSSSSTSLSSSSPSSETVSDTVNEINVSNGRHYESFGKGFLLYPSSESDPDWGEKYFGNGWWNPKRNAWFFKKEFEDEVQQLCHHKTLHHDTKTAEVSIKNDAVSAEETLGNLIAQTADGLVQLREYKQGVLLTVPKTYFKYGNPWFYTDEELGQWLNSESGWYFSRSMLPKLRENTFPWLRDLSGSWCARTKTAEITDLSQGRGKRYRLRARSKKTGRTLIEYGKGYLLKPLEDDPDWGEKYYKGGWWMPSQNGWFFKKGTKWLVFQNPS